ncbi:MAG TPA: AAA family ATPase [Nocardioidaceae bacterium]|nr:AAA family ATPase [Nocardioidaceae bacterium]
MLPVTEVSNRRNRRYPLRTAGNLVGVLQGRERERAAVGALVDGARAGRGGALVLRGLAGVGKSALLADVVARSRNLQVLRTCGVESESPLAFAALHRLLRPAMRYADRLPEPQAQALRAAFGETYAPEVDRFLVFLAALSLLAEAAEHAPILAVVDDAHWLDDASAAALLFVARRLDVEKIALVFASRDDDVRDFDSADLPELVLSGMDVEAATALVSAHAGVAVPGTVAERLVASTGGNPLALVELADALGTDQLTGAAPLPAPLPLTGGVERAFLDRARRLPEEARTLLLIVAADDAGRLSLVRQAARSLSVGDDALDDVEESGLVRVHRDELLLRHPLVRSAVYGAATSAQRRRVHRALAEALLGTGEPDRRAWHLAAAADGPDETVVAELDAVAVRARQRGGQEAAASAWERAADLTADGEARAQRLYDAARSAWLAGQTGRAKRLTETAHSAANDAGLRADIMRLRARVEWNTGSLLLGHRMILTAAHEVAPTDPVRAREMGMFAAALASFGGDSGAGIDATALAPAPPAGASPREHAFHHLLVGLDHIAKGNTAVGVPDLRAAFGTGASLDNADQDLLPNLGIAALHLGDDRAALHHHDLLLARARSTGALMMVLYSLTRRSFTDVVTGRWTAAAAGAEEALRLAETTGQPGLTALPLANLALLSALQGRDDVEARLAATDAVVQNHPLGILEVLVHDMLRWVRGLHAGAQSETAHHHLSNITHRLLRYGTTVERVEAAVRAGHRDVASAWTADLEEYAAATQAPWALAVLSHARALLTEGAEAEAHFQRALEHHSAGTLRVFDKARTELAYGEFLRRSRRRVDARTHLRAALEMFTDLGATPLAERARQELRASGETARRRDPSTTTRLTAQETQVAGLVQQGLSNREVAAQLFLSPRTIDFHLRNIYSKLGITSRAELTRYPLTEAA